MKLGPFEKGVGYDPLGIAGEDLKRITRLFHFDLECLGLGFRHGRFRF